MNRKPPFSQKSKACKVFKKTFKEKFDAYTTTSMLTIPTITVLRHPLFSPTTKNKIPTAKNLCHAHSAKPKTPTIATAILRIPTIAHRLPSPNLHQLKPTHLLSTKFSTRHSTQLVYQVQTLSNSNYQQRSFCQSPHTGCWGNHYRRHHSALS